MDKQEAIALLNENAKEWIAFALRDPDPETGTPNAFGEDIIDIMPEPSEDNNWLYDEEAGAISGQLLDGNDRIYEFTLTEDGEDNWSSSVKPAQDGQVEEFTEKEDISEVAGESSVDMEQKMVEMAQEMEYMKGLINKYEEDRKGKDKAELANFCECLYDDHKITKDQMRKEHLMELVYSVYDLCDGMQEVIAYSEEGGNKVNLLNGLKNLLGALPTQVNFSEGVSVEPAKAPAGTKKIKYDSKNYSDDSNKMDAKIRKYMAGKGWEDNPRNYTKAYREMLKK